MIAPEHLRRWAYSLLEPGVLRTYLLVVFSHCASPRAFVKVGICLDLDFPSHFLLLLPLHIMSVLSLLSYYVLLLTTILPNLKRTRQHPHRREKHHELYKAFHDRSHPTLHRQLEIKLESSAGNYTIVGRINRQRAQHNLKGERKAKRRAGFAAHKTGHSEPPGIPYQHIVCMM